MDLDRTFRDNNGIEWHVTQAGPSGPSDPVDGWLLFQSGHTERRLSPYPQGWNTMTIQRLEQMCRIATPVEWDRMDARTRTQVLPEAPPPPAPAEIVDVVSAASDATPPQPAPALNHVSRLVNTWPARETRITFRG